MKNALRRLDSFHQQLVEKISPLEPEFFCSQPSPDEWSIAQIVHHLCLVEERVTKELEKALAGPPQQISFIRRLIPTSIVSSRLIRVKAPRGMNPLNPPPKDEVIANYDFARQRLKQVCAANGEQRLRQVVFNHPFLGKIDGAAAISFLGHHENRHYKQILEVIKKLGPG